LRTGPSADLIRGSGTANGIRPGCCHRLAAADILLRGPYITQARPCPGFWHFTRGDEEQMNGAARSSEALDARRRKLLFRAWRRGLRELDLIMGRFADSAIGQLTADELNDFEDLMQVPDHELLAWVTGETDVRAKFDTALFRRLRDFNRRSEGVR
jgi:antitoxin CptB